MSPGAAAVRVLDPSTILDLLEYHGLAQEQPFPLTRVSAPRGRVRPAPILRVDDERSVVVVERAMGVRRADVTSWSSRGWT